MFLDVLGLERPGSHRCPFHEDRNASFSVRPDEFGVWRWKCFADCGKGTIVDALMLKENISKNEAIRRLTCNFPLVFSRPRSAILKHFAKPLAVPRDVNSEIARAREFAEDLEHNPEALELLWRTRGITEDAATRWGLGITGIRRGSTGDISEATWTMPVLSHEPPRPLIGVKLHRHNPPQGMNKCGWLVKGGTALFPLLEAFEMRAGDTIWLIPGELKAMGYISAGLPATAPTTGESMSLKAWEKLAPRFAGLAVKIDPDREDSQAAKTFAMNAATALLPWASSVEVLL